MDEHLTISLDVDAGEARWENEGGQRDMRRTTIELRGMGAPAERAEKNSARVRAIIAVYVGKDLLAGVLDEADLKDLKVDPIDRLGISCALDEEFLIEIPDADEEGWRTVGDVVATVQKLAV